MNSQPVIINDPSEMRLARDYSWICKLFQENNLKLREKQKIIREMISDFKKLKKLEEIKNKSNKKIK